MVFPNWENELTEENLKEEIARAKTAAKQANASEVRAKSVHYNRSTELVVIKLKNGATFSFPPKLAQGLENATPKQLDDVWLSASGNSIHWESLDADFSIPGLIAGIFGTKTWMSELGRKGGQTTSSAKSTAARENGKKGGRPKKKADAVS
jgi:hypothetical protein